MPLLVKFPVVRQHALRHDSADRSVRGDGGGVEKRVAAAERQADDGDRPAAGRPRRKINGGSFGLRQQPFLEKQIAAGVTGHAELREDNRVGAVFRSLPETAPKLLRIERRIGHLQLRDRRRKTIKSKHDVVLLPPNYRIIPAIHPAARSGRL